MKSWKRIAKSVTDAAMFVLFLLVMGEAKLPGAAHEWLGIALFALFLFHTALNIRWYRALFRGRYTAKRVVQTVVNLALLIAMLGCVVSAVSISGTVFAALPMGGAQMGRTLHLVSTAWAFLLSSVHLGLHLPALFRKILRGRRVDKTFCLLIGAIMTAFVIYGATVFAERRFWEELLCTVAFKDYGSAYRTGFPAYTLDTLMLSLGLAFLCGGLSLLLEKIHRKGKKTNETPA